MKLFPTLKEVRYSSSEVVTANPTAYSQIGNETE
jgi:hypothetical protein